MYIPQQFEESKVDAMHELIRTYPLATLVTYSSGGLNANHIPVYLSGSPAPYGALHGHIARANPLLGEIAEGIETLAIFHGPDAYILLRGTPQKNNPVKLYPPGTMRLCMLMVYCAS